MNRILLFLILLLLWHPALSQTAKPQRPILVTNTTAEIEPPALTVTIAANRRSLDLAVGTLGEVAQELAKALSDKGNYRFYDVAAADKLESCLLTHLTDSTRCIKQVGINWSDTNPVIWNEGNKVTLNLKEWPALENSLLIAIENVPQLSRLTVRVNDKAKAKILTAGDAYKQLREIRVEANRPLQASGTVVLQQRNLVINPQTFRYESECQRYPAACPSLLAEVLPSPGKPAGTPAKGEEISLRLKTKLLEGRIYDLHLPAEKLIEVGSGSPVAASGTITTPGLPASQTVSPRLSASLTSVAAVGQRAVFDLTGKLALRRAKETAGWWFDPVLAFDVGLRSTKSNNSIVLDFPFIRRLTMYGLASPRGECKAPFCAKTWASWKNTPWYTLSNLQFTVGPRLELDREFRRINTLGVARFDFRFHRWLQTTGDKRTLALADLEKKSEEGQKRAKSFADFTRGFEIVPFVAFNFGGHANNETLEYVDKSKTPPVTSRLTVPRHAIFRTYVGFQSKFEGRISSLPVTLAIEESLFHLATPEQIGYIDKGVFLRQLEGVHHRGKATLEFFFDPNKHYSFSLNYENGRLAPNFEYLNKFSTGIKVVY